MLYVEIRDQPRRVDRFATGTSWFAGEDGTLQIYEDEQGDGLPMAEYASGAWLRVWPYPEDKKDEGKAEDV